MARISRRDVLVGAAALPFVPGLARAARQPGTLMFGLSSYPPNLQPWASTGTAALTVKALMFRGLLSFGPDGKVRGELAETWERDGDTGWVFHLREASFHNGAPVTAEDVKWTIEQIAAERSGAYLRGQFQDVQSVETPDPRTVRIVMKTPVVTLPLTLATPFAPIIAKDSLKAEGGPIGAGPYTLAGQERGVSIELEAFPRRVRPGQAPGDLRRDAACSAGDCAVGRAVLALAGLCHGSRRAGVRQPARRSELLLRHLAGGRFDGVTQARRRTRGSSAP